MISLVVRGNTVLGVFEDRDRASRYLVFCKGLAGRSARRMTIREATPSEERWRGNLQDGGWKDQQERWERRNRR